MHFQTFSNENADRQSTVAPHSPRLSAAVASKAQNK